MRELKAIGVDVNAWADASGTIEAAELEAQLAKVGNEIHGKAVVALKTKRPNNNGGDWHELTIRDVSRTSNQEAWSISFQFRSSFEGLPPHKTYLSPTSLLCDDSKTTV